MSIGGASCGCSQAERHTSELLHDAVVEVASDTSAFGVRRLDGVRQEALAVHLAVTESTGEAPGEWDLHELDEEQGANGDRCELAQQRGGHRCDTAVPVVRLNEHRGAFDRVAHLVSVEQL